jgi:hypothetical protein
MEEVEQSKRGRQLHADHPVLEEAEVLKSKLSIRHHESLTTKSILNAHLGLGLSNIRQRMETDLRDKARKRKTYSMLISHLKHDLENVLAEAERHPHDQGVKKSSPLQY